MLISTLKNGNNTILFSFIFIFLIIRLSLASFLQLDYIVVLEVFFIHLLASLFLNRIFISKKIIKKQSRLVPFFFLLLTTNEVFLLGVEEAISFFLYTLGLSLIASNSIIVVPPAKIFNSAIIIVIAGLISPIYWLVGLVSFLVFFALEGEFNLKRVFIILIAFFTVAYLTLTTQITLLNNNLFFKEYIGSLQLRNVLDDYRPNFLVIFLMFIFISFLGVFDLLKNIERKNISTRRFVQFIIILSLFSILSIFVLNFKEIHPFLIATLVMNLILTNYFQYSKIKLVHKISFWLIIIVCLSVSFFLNL